MAALSVGMRGGLWSSVRDEMFWQAWRQSIFLLASLTAAACAAAAAASALSIATIHAPAMSSPDLLHLTPPPAHLPLPKKYLADICLPTDRKYAVPYAVRSV